MEIRVVKNENLKHYDTGGAIREIEVVISVDSSLSHRLQRQFVIFETLGCCLAYSIPKEEREMITEKLMDALDQIEPLGGEE